MEKYFFKELMKVFTLFIASFYFLYVLIDYSTHTKIFHSLDINFLYALLYYLCQFTKRADILIPIALTIAVVKVLTTSNLRHEIVALTTGGISFKKIINPFLWFAGLCALFLYLNFQCLQPPSLHWINSFEERYFHRETKHDESGVHSLLLADNSLMIYQSFNHENRSFFDAYWLKDENVIYRIQFLFPYEKIPLGTYVDILERNSMGEMVKIASHQELSLPSMQIDPKALFSAIYPPHMQSISQLARGLNWKHKTPSRAKMSDREAEMATFFYFKSTAPLVCFLAVMGPAPFCLRFTRNLPVFLIFALTLFGMITFFTLTKSLLIFGKNQVIAPFLAILLPQITLFLLLVLRYAKL